MIAVVAIIVLVIVVLVAMAVAIRHHQLTQQLVELDNKIEQLEAKLVGLETNYFIECEIDALVQQRNNVRRKMFF